MAKKTELTHDIPTMNQEPKITIIGTGPIGSWLAHELIANGSKISFVDRDASIRERCWTIERDGIVHTWTTSLERSKLPTSDLIFVAARADDLDAIWQEHASDLPVLQGRTIIVCCNGDIEATVKLWQTARPDITFLIGVVTAGITEKTNNHYLRNDRTGKCFYGPLTSEQSEPHKADVKNLSSEFIYDPDIRERARKKWLFNTAANTLAGALQLPRNDLMIYVHRNCLRELFDEAYDLACERWIAWHLKDGANPKHREALWLELCQLIADTGSNENSMSRAARLGKGMGEAMFLGGMAFGHRGYPTLKRMTNLLLKGGPSFPA